MAAAEVIRPADASDFAAVLALWRDARGALGRTDDEAAFLGLLERDHGSILVAEVDGRIVGSLIAAWDGWRGNMYRLTVHPELRRRGIARRLVAAGEERLQRLGARRISALVWEEDDRAMGTWLAAGYEHDRGTARLVRAVGA